MKKSTFFMTLCTAAAVTALAGCGGENCAA